MNRTMMENVATESWGSKLSPLEMKNMDKAKDCELSITAEIPTLFAQKSPQALHKDRGPDGPRRIIGVEFELMPQ